MSKIKDSTVIFLFLILVSFCTFTLVYGQSEEDDYCKCPIGKVWNGKQCIKNTHKTCPSKYDPVCGCDGRNYTNICVATLLNGIKQSTNGECLRDRSGDECKCSEGNIWNGRQCIKPTIAFKCDDEQYIPVCACDGHTYNNYCVAFNKGLKESVTRECEHPVPEDETRCLSDNDCPLGFCSSGFTYQSDECNTEFLDDSSNPTGVCLQKHFSTNPCLLLTSSSSSGQLTKIAPSQGFTGVWKTKVIGGGCTGLPGNGIGSCIYCPDSLVICPSGFTPIAETCSECAHCVETKNTQKNLLANHKSNTSLREKLSCPRLDPTSITFNLCVKDNKINGFVDLGDNLGIANIISFEIFDDNSLLLTVNRKGIIERARLFLFQSHRKTLLRGAYGNFGEYPFLARKLDSSKNCSSEGSTTTPETNNNLNLIGITKDCTPFGKCSNLPGKHFKCPNGTSCKGTGLCIPIGCPIPGYYYYSDFGYASVLTHM